MISGENESFVFKGMSEPSLQFTSFNFPSPGLSRIEGVNGSGKSILVELLSGAASPSSGSIEFDGVDSMDGGLRYYRSVCRSKVALYDPISVRQLIEFASDAMGCESARGIDLASFLGLGPWLDVPVVNLSLGSSRKCWISMICSWGFRYCILDEPFLGLDEDSTFKLKELILSWSEDSSVVVVDHEGNLAGHGDPLYWDKGLEPVAWLRQFSALAVSDTLYLFTQSFIAGGCNFNLCEVPNGVTLACLHPDDEALRRLNIGRTTSSERVVISPP